MSETPPLFLYIEDDPASRKVMEFLITRILGAQIVIFEDTSDFLVRLRALPVLPMVIFVDIHIGPLDGYEVLRLMRAERALQSIPIIAMTASVTSQDVSQVKEAGFDGLVGKPIKAPVFPNLLKRILIGEEVWFVS